MIDFHKIQIKSNIFDNWKNKNEHTNLNVDNNQVKSNKEKNADISQIKENELIDIISKGQEQENYIVYYKSNNSKNPFSKKKEENKPFTSFIQNNSNISKSFNSHKSKGIYTNRTKEFLDEPNIYSIANEEEQNIINIVQPIKIKQKEIEKEKKEEKEYSLIMTCLSLFLLIKIPPVGILFFFYWMIKMHKRRMIIIILILIILVIFFSLIA